MAWVPHLSFHFFVLLWMVSRMRVVIALLGGGTCLVVVVWVEVFVLVGVVMGIL